MLIAEFTLSSPVLRDSLGAAPGTAVELDRVVSQRPTRVAVLARGQDINRFEDALAADDSVEEVAVRGRGPTFAEYEVTLTTGTEERTTAPWRQDHRLEPLAAVGTSKGWDVRMRFPSRESLAAYRDGCRQRNVSFTLHAVYVQESLNDLDELSLAPEQPGGVDDADDATGASSDEAPGAADADIDESVASTGTDADTAPTGPDVEATAGEMAENVTDDG